MKKAETRPEEMTCKEAAKELGCSLNTAYALFDKGELKGRKEGKRRIVYATSITDYQERHSNARLAKKKRPPR